LVQAVSSEPAIDAQHLLRWQIFNVLAGNSDGHAKNLALLYPPGGGIRLAPFYDLACTRAIERIDEHLAFGVGGERNPRLVTRAHWEELARTCDVRPRFLLGLVDEIATRLLDQLAPVRAAFEEQVGEYPALQRIEQVVNRQIRRNTRRQ
jgi:serine/threonine-protein kinase HipA